MNLAESLLNALHDHGAREIFGIPGDFALPFFKVIEHSGILPLYTLSHEPGVGFAADAAARLRSAPAVAAVTYGAGALNMVNAVAAAYVEKAPVVVISGAPGRGEVGRGLLLHHQVKSLDSQLQIYREITCAQAQLDDVQRAPQEIARVLRACVTQSRPVYLELPRTAVFEPCAAVTPLPADQVDGEAVQACVDEVLARLAHASSPVLMAGVEVRRFGLEAKVDLLAQRLGIPVVTSFLGRGLLAKSAAPVLGTYLGVAGDPAITQLVEQSDALLLLGVIVSDTNFGVSGRNLKLRHAIHAENGAVSLDYHTYPHVPLAALVDALLARMVISRDAPTAVARQYPRNLSHDDQPITPTDIACAINDLFAAHGRMPLASDMGDCLFTALDIDNTELVSQNFYATMGYGVPGGIGAEVATGQRPIILVGDGAFQMTGWELGNCRRYGWDPIVLLFNNQGWEMLRVFQPESRFNDLDDWHFAALAENLGGVGVRVHTRAALALALARAVEQRGRFFLIEIMLAPGAVSQTLSRFVAALSAARGG
jgi:indolepyruvate decarboxylase